MRALPWLLTLGLAGCFMANSSPAKKISDSVRDLNENARWGRIGDASLMVDGSYRNTFMSSHQGWGSEFELADAEVEHVQIDPSEEHASAIVSYSWYATDTMTLHTTTVRQRWSAVSGGYALFSEAVVKGDPRLLPTPTPEAPPTPDDIVRSTSARRSQ
jgi:hypothetical protein